MPGTKAKQAAALAYNIRWMADTFGVERVGFLTLTVGDTVNGRFVKVSERAEASRRFNSILNRIRERYQCGVVVTERHKDGGIHFHLVVVLPFDAKTGFDFERVKRRDYRSVSKELRDEWLWWRENQAKYGFGRHELTPIKSNGEAIGRYVGKYLGKSWEARTDDDYRGRCVRFFGVWMTEEQERKAVEANDGKPVKCGPPMSSRFGTLTKRACAWRECAKQVQLQTKRMGVEINEHNIAEKNGPRWAWRITKQFNRVEFLVADCCREIVRQGIKEHNEEPAPEQTEERRAGSKKPIAIWDTSLDHWWQQPEWESELNRQDIASRRWRGRWKREDDRKAALEHSWAAAMLWYEGLRVEQQEKLCQLN